MTRPIEALPRGDFSPLSCPCPYGAHRFFPIIAQDFSPGSLAGRPKVVKADKVCDQIFKEVIVYDQGPRVSTLGRPRPGGTRAPAAGDVKEDKLYDQTYRGSASRGLQSPFLPVPLRGTPLLPNHNPGFQPWVVRGLGAPVPLRLGSSKKISSMTRPTEALPRGDFSPLFCPCPYGAHRFLPIIAQGFNPGWPCAPAAGHRIKKNNPGL